MSITAQDMDDKIATSELSFFNASDPWGGSFFYEALFFGLLLILAILRRTARKESQAIVVTSEFKKFQRT